MDWYYAKDGEAIKISEEELKSKIRNNEIYGNVLVVNEELQTWRLLKETHLYRDIVWKREHGFGTSEYRTTIQTENVEKLKPLAIFACISSAIGAFLFLPIVFCTIGLICGIIVQSENPKEKWKAIWNYDNKARGFADNAVFVGAVGLVLVVLQWLIAQGVFG